MRSTGRDRLERHVALALCALAFALAWASPAFAQASGPPPAEPGTTRIALLGCLRQDRPVPALEKYSALKPDLSVWVGDNVYADTADDPGFIESCYRRLENRPGFRELREAAPFAVTWDDHDFGLNNSGKTYALKEESKRIFRRFWGLEDEIPADRDGVYHARAFEVDGHTLRVILLDIRYNRDDPYTGGDMLGQRQWRWLENELRASADLTLVVSGTQIILDGDAGWESWGQYPAARSRLFETIRDAAAENVVFVAGDQHYAEANRMRGALDFDAVELMFAGVNQIEPHRMNSYRVTPVGTSEHSYAYVDVQWGGTSQDLPHMVFRVHDAETDAIDIHHRVNFKDIRLSLRIEGHDEFVDEHAVRIEHEHPALHARYTTDGTDPTAASSRYRSPIIIKETTTVKTALFTEENRRRSRVRSRTLRSVEPLRSVRVGQTEPGLRFGYWEGSFLLIPDFSAAEPIREGVASDFDVGELASREDGFAIEYRGFLQVPESGMYTFWTRSDDGSKLYVHDELVVDNDGSHSPRTRRGRIALERGHHPVRIEYFEHYAGQDLDVGWEGPGVEYGSVPFERFSHARE